MKNMKSLVLITGMLFINPAFAQISKEQASKIIIEFQVKEAIKLLIKSGVLNIENSELVVKRPSVLEELQQQGHVDSGHATTSAICIKE